jgi:hypothetical protein
VREGANREQVGMVRRCKRLEHGRYIAADRAFQMHLDLEAMPREMSRNLRSWRSLMAGIVRLRVHRHDVDMGARFRDLEKIARGPARLRTRR